MTSSITTIHLMEGDGASSRGRVFLGSHFDGSTEYVPTGASRVKNSVYYLRDTMRDQDLNTYVPPVTPPTPSDKTEVEKNPDSSTTTTVTKPDGSQTITHLRPSPAPSPW